MLIKNRKIMQTCDSMLLTVNKNCFPVFEESIITRGMASFLSGYYNKLLKEIK